MDKNRNAYILDGYEGLAAAIIRQSIKDHKQKIYKEETEMFWRSAWFDLLCLGNGDRIRRLCAQVTPEEEEYMKNDVLVLSATIGAKV